LGCDEALLASVNAMKQLASTWVAVLCGLPMLCQAGPSLFRRSSLLEVEGKSTIQATHKAYPLPVVSHAKAPGQGYTRDSPLYSKQQAWTAINGDNSLTGLAPDDLFKDIPEPYRPIWRMYYEDPFLMITGTLVHVLLYILLAWVYQKYKNTWELLHPAKELYAPAPGGQCCGWHRMFSDPDKKSDCRILLCSFCCPIIRWADTIDNHKLMKGKYWHAFFLMLIFGTIAPFTFGISILASLCVGIYFRQKIRQVYDRHPYKPLSLLEDVFCWCCCTPCAIAQEAHEIEKVKRPGA